MSENLPNLKEEADIQVLEAQKSPNKTNQRDPHQDIMKMVKVKQRIIKAAREKPVNGYMGSLIRIPADLSVETSQSRRDHHDIFKVLKGKIL